MRPLGEQRRLAIASWSRDQDEFVVRDATLEGLKEPDAAHRVMRLRWDPQFGRQENSIHTATAILCWFLSARIIPTYRNLRLGHAAGDHHRDRLRDTRWGTSRDSTMITPSASHRS